MRKMSKRSQLILLACIVLTACVLGTAALNRSRGNVDVETLEPTAANDSEVQAEEEETVLVHVKGAVKQAGLYELPEGSRINDAIEAAGGAAENADLNAVNLATTLNDGDELNIPDTSGGARKPVVANAASDGSGGTSGKVNLNTASASELEKIPGVGEATAQKIIVYRQNTPFKRIEDIMQIGGISQKKFDSMKDFITV